MNKLFVVVGQIVIGVIVGNAASEGIEKFVVKPIKKAVEAKKGESK